MKEGLIALNYECSKCNERMGLYEQKSAVLDGDFEWVCSTITSQNIYGRTPMILLTMRPSKLFVKIRCHAVASTRKRSAVRNVEKMLNSCVMHRHTGPAPGIMVWGGIGYHSRSPLARIAGTLNCQRYISEVLEPVVLPYLQGLATAIFKQDNARLHVARIVQRFFRQSPD
ncbi:uncharacterized protein TNCV_4397441 [Trichonephila clavipes]|nr:uncharacterized protein TNCV_4397441 [Trichonephila clavipes]